MMRPKNNWLDIMNIVKTEGNGEKWNGEKKAWEDILLIEYS